MMLMRANSPANNALRLQRMLHLLRKVRKTRNGYSAQCPAHADRSPSLSVKESRDGTILVRCFAGCTAAQIVAAMGMELKQLFPNARTAFARPQTRPTAEEVRAALRAEANAACEPGDRLTIPEMNAVRHRVAAKLGISLPALPTPIYDSGAYGGRAHDPLWPAVFEHALFVAHVEMAGRPPEQNSRRVDPNVLIRAEEIAADMLRVEEHAASECLSHGRLAS